MLFTPEIIAYTTIMQEILFVVLLVTLFFVSRLVTKQLSSFVFHITKSTVFTIQFLAVIFLPGVILHELSHWLMASFLFVPTGEIEFLPQVRGDTVKLGSVQVAKTDFIRRFLIGVAPLFGGMVLLTAIYYYLSPTIMPFTYSSIIFLYVLFEVGNTMFSSRKDMVGALGVGILISLVAIASMFFHFWPFLLKILALPPLLFFSMQASLFCLFAIGVDVLLLVTLLLMQAISQRSL